MASDRSGRRGAQLPRLGSGGWLWLALSYFDIDPSSPDGSESSAAFVVVRAPAAAAKRALLVLSTDTWNAVPTRLL